MSTRIVGRLAAGLLAAGLLVAGLLEGEVVVTNTTVGAYRHEVMVGEPRPEDVQATCCATLVDQWIALGVSHAVIAPGSRSTPMALAIAERPELAVHVVVDERSAAFVALGLGLDGIPALLLCTSGTAAANFYPAVVEAGLSEVPLVVLTADRPDELRDVGAPQTIDQIELYGHHVRWFCDADVPDAASADEWRPLAVDAWSHAQRGPVQLNLPFREPLVGVAYELPPTLNATLDGRVEAPVAAEFAGVPDGCDAVRGLILVGGRSGVAVDDIAELHRRTRWPIIADPISGMRHLEGTVCFVDALLRDADFADRMEPDVIIRVGRPATSKVLAQWTARPAITLVQVGGPGVIDPARNVAAVCTIDSVLQALSGGPSGDSWSIDWAAADETARAAIHEALSGFDGLTEPGVARLLAEHLPNEAGLTVSSSMPVRDLEWFGGASARAHANRGANGIDGVISTALGRALQGRPEVLLIGDLAFVHDSNALVGLMSREADLRIVVVDNDGGGIFSFLPQASELSHERFEQLFGTPHGADVLGLATAHGVPAIEITNEDDLTAQLFRQGPWVVRVRSDRNENVRVHAELNTAVVEALRSLPNL